MEAKNSGKPWNEADLLNLLTSFDAGFGIKQLASILGRTEIAIRARLRKYGRTP